jgi:hypothetical protein
MAVAEIARRQLSERARAECDRLLAVNALPDSATFVTASVWADDLKAKGVRAYDEWHYKDLPLEEGAVGHAPPKSANVEWAIEQCEKTLRSPAAPDSEKARALKFLIHFVGDAHQPLHCVGRYTNLNPDGDQGGNRHLLEGGKYRNLHAYWDSGAGLFEDIARPLTTEGEKQLAAIVDEALKANPVDKLPGAKVLRPAVWIQEGYALAKEAVYVIPENSAPTDRYRQSVQRHSRRQVALAGVRLAALLNDIYK